MCPGQSVKELPGPYRPGVLRGGPADGREGEYRAKFVEVEAEYGPDWYKASGETDDRGRAIYDYHGQPPAGSRKER